jgi:hypothetical protein
MRVSVTSVRTDLRSIVAVMARVSSRRAFRSRYFCLSVAVLAASSLTQRVVFSSGW